MLKQGAEVLDRFEKLPCPTIAVVHGMALGAGFEIALACDYRIAVDGAKFGFPEVNLGLHPGLGGTYRLPALGAKAVWTFHTQVTGGLGTFEFSGQNLNNEPTENIATYGVGASDLDGDGAPEDAPHTSSIYALRDSEIVGFSREGWHKLVKSEPELLEQMIRIILRRVGREREPEDALHTRDL